MNREIKEYIDMKMSQLKKDIIAELRHELNNERDNSKKEEALVVYDQKLNVLKGNISKALIKLENTVVASIESKVIKPLEKKVDGIQSQVAMLNQQNISGEEITAEYYKRLHNATTTPQITDGKTKSSRTNFGASEFAFGDEY